ncbi:Aste57867_23901 [Aphanomyces stellatus]|uniref:Aste57867_23901 protein n=1 Tax=Aphanomyces stellatus TaxID=120398 RepID=A0A485LP94_9STRA|nr:hypothetical protein As57867_023828 [Aphanomyces stellatus]VFU00544.1 Aste57867_23901 [Aphanomyces stellatus]
MISSYEEARRANIARNKAMLESLGIEKVVVKTSIKRQRKKSEVPARRSSRVEKVLVVRAKIQQVLEDDDELFRQEHARRVRQMREQARQLKHEREELGRMRREEQEQRRMEKLLEIERKRQQQTDERRRRQLELNAKRMEKQEKERLRNVVVLKLPRAWATTTPLTEKHDNDDEDDEDIEVDDFFDDENEDGDADEEEDLDDDEDFEDGDDENALWVKGSIKRPQTPEIVEIESDDDETEDGSDDDDSSEGESGDSEDWDGCDDDDDSAVMASLLDEQTKTLRRNGLSTAAKSPNAHVVVPREEALVVKLKRPLTEDRLSLDGKPLVLKFRHRQLVQKIQELQKLNNSDAMEMRKKSRVQDADMEYDVRLSKGTHGLCVEFGVEQNKIKVMGFRQPQPGQVGPAEASGKISLGDELIAVEGEAVRDASRFKRFVPILKSGLSVTLRFRRCSQLT